MTAMSMMRPSEPLRVVSPGRRGGSSATGRGRGDNRLSPGDITCNQDSNDFWSTLIFIFETAGGMFVFSLNNGSAMTVMDQLELLWVGAAGSNLDFISPPQSKSMFC